MSPQQLESLTMALAASVHMLGDMAMEMRAAVQRVQAVEEDLALSRKVCAELQEQIAATKRGDTIPPPDGSWAPFGAGVNQEAPAPVQVYDEPWRLAPDEPSGRRSVPMGARKEESKP